MHLLHEPRTSPDFKSDKYDRFIRSSNDLRRRFGCMTDDLSHRPNQVEDAIIYKKLFSDSNETYKQLLTSAMSVSRQVKKWEPIWSVRARRNPYVSSSCAILDLPDITNSFCTNLVDWSSKDHLTVAFPRSVYLWFAPTNTTLRFAEPNSTCIKWTNDGTNLFTASKNGEYKFTNIEHLPEPYIRSHTNCHLYCHITSCGFHPSTNLLIAGCSKGAITHYVVDKKATFLTQYQEFNKSVTAVTFSCDGKHFACASVLGIVVVRDVISNNLVFYATMAGPVRAVAWHPWERSTLVVGDLFGNMNLYNIFAQSELKATYSSVFDSAIVALTFNPVSAELVVSHRICGSYISDPNTTYNSTQINVLASFDRVVDRLEGHTGRVLFMNWNPDGTKLATCGSDETARIWRFLPKDRKLPIRKAQESNSMSSLMELSSRLGITLR